jgi:D-alanyl-D-alanine carboxypeptidase
MIITLHDLFFGMMLPSGNDAAYQIALVGGAIINLSR